LNAVGTAVLRPSISASYTESGAPHELRAASASVQVTVSADLTPPTTSATYPAANVFGWYKAPVTVHFTAVDNAGGSGVEGTYFSIREDNQPWTRLNSADLTVGGRGIHTLAYRSIDRNRIEETPQTLVIRIDPDAPTMRASAITSVQPPVNGWYHTDPTITFGADENLSGIAEITAPITVTTEGANQTVTGFAVDRAGNRSEDARVTVNVDKTAPQMTCAISGGAIVWPPNHKMVPVAFTVSVKDAVSGVATSGPNGAKFRLISAESNEPANGKADGNTNPDLEGWALGTADTAGQVRAERAGTGTGRVYTFVYEAWDNAGNRATCGVNVAVPHDQRKP
jgi:hypothetical protein